MIGTHAVIAEAVTFERLALAVVDEQHRFGVAQRAALQAKGGGREPHLLALTATPIPRTLALTFYADMAISTIREMPPGRRAIRTEVRNRGAAEDRGVPRLRGGRGPPVVRGRPARRRERSARRAPGPRPSSSGCARRCRSCGSASSTGSRRRTCATRPWPRSPPESSTCWSRPRWSRSGSTSRTHRSCWSRTPTGSDSPSSISSAGGSAVATAVLLHPAHRRGGRPLPRAARGGAQLERRFADRRGRPAPAGSGQRPRYPPIRAASAQGGVALRATAPGPRRTRRDARAKPGCRRSRLASRPSWSASATTWQAEDEGDAA